MNVVTGNMIVLLSFVLVLGSVDGSATTLDTLRHYDVQPLGSYSAIWGYTAPDGREYAILGVNGSSSVPYPGGTSIIDITDAPTVQQVAFIGGPNSSWREMKTYKHYAYVVTEAGGGVQIINLSQLPDTAWLVKSFNYTSAGKNISRVHSVSLHDGFLYLNGCANWAPGGTVIFDLRNDPENPVYAGEYQPAYLHDTYVLRDTIYGSAINGQGLYIADARNKSSIQPIGLISYSGSGTHNAWVTKDRQHVITTDEIGSTAKTLKFWDISNLPTIPSSPVSTYTPAPGQIEHNVTVRGDYAYVAWYSAGVQVVNVSNPAVPVNAGGYDTSPTTSGYNGAWGVYPYFPSGKIIAGDIQNGLWVFSFSDLAARVPVSLLQPADSVTLSGMDPQVFRWTKAADLDKDPHYYAFSVSGPGIDTVINAADSVATLSGFVEGQSYQWHVATLDEFNNTASPDTFSFVYANSPPALPLLQSPANDAQDQQLSVLLDWTTVVGASSYRVQVATDSNFAFLILDDSTVTGTSHLISSLAHNQQYYWRVQAQNTAGESGFTVPWKFTTVVAPPSSPVPESPDNGAIDQPVALTLEWSVSNSATTYHLQLALDSLFATLVVNDSTLTDTLRSVTGLQNLATYYWRVRGGNIGGFGPFGTVFNFTTIISMPSVPVLSSPINAALNQPTTLDLVWLPSNAASSYRLQVSGDSMFSMLVFDDSTLTDTIRQIDSLLPGEPYYWRVRAENAAGQSGWSAFQVFTTTLMVSREYSMTDGWNLVAVPLAVANSLATSLFPDAVSGAFTFQGTTGYVQQESLVNGAGYWLKFKADITESMAGELREADTVQVLAGWNLIGGLSNPIPISSIQQIPTGIVASDFFAYNGGYSSADSLLPFVGYWVKVSEDGALVILASPTPRRIVPEMIKREKRLQR